MRRLRTATNPWRENKRLPMTPFDDRAEVARPQSIQGGVVRVKHKRPTQGLGPPSPAVEGHDPIFPTSGGKPQSHANVVQRGWYPALKRAGIYDWKTKIGKHVRFHDLRPSR